MSDGNWMYLVFNGWILMHIDKKNQPDNNDKVDNVSHVEISRARNCDWSFTVLGKLGKSLIQSDCVLSSVVDSWKLPRIGCALREVTV